MFSTISFAFPFPNWNGKLSCSFRFSIINLFPLNSPNSTAKKTTLCYDEKENIIKLLKPSCR